jgi:hypothetical protein
MIGHVDRSVLHRAVLIRGQSRVINSGSRPRGTIAHERVGDALSLLGDYKARQPLQTMQAVHGYALANECKGNASDQSMSSRPHIG